MLPTHWRFSKLLSYTMLLYNFHWNHFNNKWWPLSRGAYFNESKLWFPLCGFEISATHNCVHYQHVKNSPNIETCEGHHWNTLDQYSSRNMRSERMWLDMIANVNENVRHVQKWLSRGTLNEKLRGSLKCWLPPLVLRPRNEVLRKMTPNNGHTENHNSWKKSKKKSAKTRLHSQTVGHENHRAQFDFTAAQKNIHGRIEWTGVRHRTSFFCQPLVSNMKKKNVHVISIWLVGSFFDMNARRGDKPTANFRFVCITRPSWMLSLSVLEPYYWNGWYWVSHIDCHSLERGSEIKRRKEKQNKLVKE